ncbi:MAG: FtsQ-type POTRA domain-containing protein [Candidatus Sulfotelmatobacter sp.]|jgi:cell division protein FtsQ
MARKSGPTILQEELYPPSAGAAREEMEDARLVDLDLDEESPFLRGQRRISARRSSLPKKTANRLLWAVVAATVFCAGAFGAALLYHYGEHSWRFRVESSDEIEVTGMQNATKAQIMEVMGADIGRNIFFIPLAQQKAQLEQIPWVESASVMRFVPNRLKVEIHERMPVAFARVGPRMALIDAGGTLMELSPKHRYSFPVILGMNPGEPLSTRAPRMKIYSEMVRELESGGAHYSQDLSEVDLTDLEDVKVRVNDAAGDVLIHLGSSDYLRRYKIYVTHAQGWRQQFQRLESVDLRYDNQIIVNPDMERTAKQVPLNPGMAKAAAAAGVKQASLLTRIAPNDRQVPKPAFELSARKVDLKSASSGSKNAGGKPKAADPAATVRKTAATGKAAKGRIAKKPVERAHAARRPAAGKKLRSATPNAKPPHGTGGQKPSAAVAKTPAEQEPSD